MQDLAVKSRQKYINSPDIIDNSRRHPNKFQKKLTYTRPSIEQPKVWISYFEREVNPFLTKSFIITDLNHQEVLVEKLIDNSKSYFFSPDFELEGIEPDEEVFERAAEFLRNYSSLLYNQFNSRLSLPFFDFTNDNSAYLHWNTEKAEFLIIFKPQQDNAYFFGNPKAGKVSIKGACGLSDFVNDDLLTWFNKYLVDNEL